MKELKYLRYILDENGVQADQERVKPIIDFPTSKCVKDVRRVIGMAGWYRRFI